jgi:hypothetical protein
VTGTAIAGIISAAAAVALISGQAPAAAVRVRPDPAATPAWVQNTAAVTPPAAFGAVSFADPRSGQTVLFGGSNGRTELNTTWIWDGTSWTQAHPATSPPARQGAVGGWDAASSSAIMFGGLGRGGDLADTWQWTGDNWVQLHPATSPPARAGAALAFSGPDRRLLLFGGFQADHGDLSDTWEWNGTTWIDRRPATAPSPRQGAAMAADPAGDLVLFGGLNDATTYADTWRWTGDNWASLQPATSPPGRSYAAAGYSQGTGAIVLAGGRSGTGAVLTDTWKWSGSAWQPLTVGTALPGRYYAAVCADPATGQLLVIGGHAAGATPLADQWRLADPAVAFWRQLHLPGNPGGRFVPAAAADPETGQVVMFGGAVEGRGPTDDTWIYQDGNWKQAKPATAPPPLAWAVMAFDTMTKQLILFGGLRSLQPFQASAETWLWSGATWRKLTPAQSPPALVQAAMANDPARGLLLYGGLADPLDPATIATTWRWTGSTWAVQPSVLNPGFSLGPGMAYDPITKQVVFFGGALASIGAGDATWTFGSLGWLPAFPADKPVRQLTPSMATDAADGGVLLFGGSYPSEQSGDPVYTDATWLWTGQNWRRLTLLYSPSPRSGAVLAPLGDGSILLYGGSGPPILSQLTDTWIYGRVGPS